MYIRRINISKVCSFLDSPRHGRGCQKQNTESKEAARSRTGGWILERERESPCSHGVTDRCQGVLAPLFHARGRGDRLAAAPTQRARRVGRCCRARCGRRCRCTPPPRPAIVVERLAVDVGKIRLLAGVPVAPSGGRYLHLFVAGVPGGVSNRQGISDAKVFI